MYIKFSVGLWDQMFGKKATFEIPDENGNVVTRTVSQNWMDRMIAQGKMSYVIRVHVLDPFLGYRTINWTIGEDIDKPTADKFKDPRTGELYAVVAYEKGEATTMVVVKDLFEKTRATMNNPKANDELESDTAAGLVVQSALERQAERWERIKADIIYYEEAFGHVKGTWVQYELVLASLGTDLLALYNLFPRVSAEGLHQSLLNFLRSMPDTGEYSVEAVNEYYKVAQQAVSENEHPLEFVVSLLMQRLEVPENFTDPITMTGLMSAVGQLVGRWKWMSENFTIIQEK